MLAAFPFKNDLTPITIVGVHGCQQDEIEGVWSLEVILKVGVWVK